MYIYLCILLSDRVIRDHSCGGMITYAGERHEEVPGYEESSRKSSPDRSMRLVSCGYNLILCAYAYVYVMDR